MSKINFTKLVLIMLNLNTVTLRKMETMFTSISEIETLIDTKEAVMKSLKEYINAEKANIDIVERFLNHTKTQHMKASQDIIEYLANPINAYTLVKRLHVDLLALEMLMKKKIGYKKNRLVKYPTEEALAGAAIGVVRIQMTYDLNITELSNGILKYTARDNRMHSFVEIVTPMTASDCYELGLVPAEIQGHMRKITWMTEALNKYKKENCSICIMKELSAIDHITDGFYKMGQIKSTIEWIKMRMALRPNSKETLKQVKFMKKLERQLNTTISETRNKLNESVLKENETKPSTNNFCHEKVNVPESIKKKLKCGYMFGPHKFLRLAPIKLEMLSIAPDVMLFHQVISDTEIRILQHMARSKLWRDKVPGKSLVEFRYASAAFMDERLEYVSQLTRRAFHFTGLNMIRSESLKVVNYGIGGHYRAHHDFHSNDTTHIQTEFITKGDRIATVMFYLSEVEGGATVFPILGLKVQPAKGSALFWFNLHPSGDGNYITAHEACPVLRGSKWIAIKWAREADQRYCPLWRTPQGIMNADVYSKSNIHEPFRDVRFMKNKTMKKFIRPQIKM